jgi:hypothetical protein
VSSRHPFARIQAPKETPKEFSTTVENDQSKAVYFKYFLYCFSCMQMFSFFITTMTKSNGTGSGTGGGYRVTASAVVAALALVAAGAASIMMVDAIHPIVRPQTKTTTTAMTTKDRHAFIPPPSSSLNKIRGGSTPVYDEEDEEEEEEEMFEEAEILMDDGDTDEEEEEEEEEKVLVEDFEEEDEEEVDDWEDLEELEEDIIAVEVAALEEEEEQEEVDDLMEELEDEVGQEIVDEVLEELIDEEEESPVMVGSTTTDGELADDEETDSNVASPEELVSVTAGGAAGVAAAIIDDEGDDDEADVVETTSEVAEISGISDEMSQILLKDLSYTKREVKLMRPDIAAMVVYNRLSRPGEGMPPNFYVEGYGPPGPLREHGAKIVVTAIAVGTVALTAASIKEGDLDLSDISDALKSIPKALLAAGAAIKGKAYAAIPSKKKTVSRGPGLIEGRPAQMVEVEVVEETTKGTEEEDRKDLDVEEDLKTMHSIKPGTKAGPKVNEDETALDKFLTKIENLIKAFFRIKI